MVLRYLVAVVVCATLVSATTVPSVSTSSSSGPSAPAPRNIHIDTPQYAIDCLGQCPYDVVRAPLIPAWVLMGGGEPSRTGLQYMVNASQVGDFVILRTPSGPQPFDWLNPIVQALGPLNSVTTITIKTLEGASNPTILTRIANAEALFLPAGDVWEYYSTLNGSPTQMGLNNITMQTGGIIGGNAEGLSLLGDFVFTAEKGPVVSQQALNDPMARGITLGWKFISAKPMAKVIAEPFLVSKDRMGQMITLLARIISKEWATTPTVRGLGMDDGSCVVIGDNGNATALSTGTMFFLSTLNDPEVCEPGSALTFTGVNALRLDLTPGLQWRWASWKPPTALAFDLDVNNGLIAQENRYGPDGPLPGPPG